MAKRGRKTKYRPELCQKLIDFFDVEPYSDVDIFHFDKAGKKDEKGNRLIAWIDKKRMPNKLPTLIGFAKSIGCGIRTVYDWIDENHNSYKVEFSQTFLCVAKRLQKEFMIQNGLQGLYNPISFKFIAVNVTDMRDSKEVTTHIDQQQRELNETERKEAVELAKIRSLKMRKTA